MSDPNDRYAEILVALHQLGSSEGEGLTGSLQRVAYLAHRGVPGVEAVGVTLRSGQGGTTVAFHGDEAKPLDDAQYRDDTGPCLEAFRERVTIRVDRIADELSRWPSFVRTADDLRIRSSLSLPLLKGSKAVGALNLYAGPEAAFPDESVAVGEQFAMQASVAVTNAAVYWQARDLAGHLVVAVESRDRIGQAKGILIATQGVTGDEAFERIREVSQKRNVKVVDLADEIIWTGQLSSDASH